MAEKHLKIKRTVFNGDKKEFETDYIDMSEKMYKEIVSKPEYQKSIKDKSVATPIVLIPVEEWENHKDFVEKKPGKKIVNKKADEQE